MAEPRRILIIDDSELVLARMRSALIGEGFDVVTTTQTVGSARHLKGCDLVIVDLHMPGFDGTSVLSSLKSAIPPNTPRPLFYLYTTDAQASSDYAKLGFDGCFTNKGDSHFLIPQVHAALRLLRMRELSAKK